MLTVTLAPLLHRNNWQMAISFERNIKIANIVKKINSARWSKTCRCWYVPLSKENSRFVYTALQPHCRLAVDAMKEWFDGKSPAESANAVKQNLNKESSKRIRLFSTSVKLFQLPAASSANTIHSTNAHVLHDVYRHLELKAYSPNTIKTYLNEVAAFLHTIGHCRAEKFTVNRIKDYLQYCYHALGLSENTLHSRTNALKFYYEQVLKYDRFFWEIPRPKKPLMLPKVLGESELRRLFSALTCVKHKAILFTAYSAGLRVSEVINLQMKHIDRSRMQMLIARSKGKKDRYVGLSPVLLDILEQYYKQWKPRPLTYLFEGTQPGSIYQVRTAQKIFQVAKAKAGICKEVSFHCLRHSFATHLLEKGIDIKYIKDLLGHFDIRTTERYLHVQKEKLIHIVSPLDDLWKGGELD